MTHNSGKKGFELNGRRVLALLVAFFGTIFAVNGIFLYQALSTRTGIVANEPYRKGLKYNERIAADVRQKSLGWNSELVLDAGGKSLAFTVTDDKGEPVKGLIVRGQVGRPTTDRQDQPLALVEQQAGHYEAPFPIADAGAFIADIEVSENADAPDTILYRMRRRLWVQH